MNIINTVKNAAFNTALTSTLHYLEKDPEINIPKAMDLIDKVVPDGWYESQRAAFRKAITEKNNWYQLILKTYQLDEGVRKTFFRNFIMNSALKGSAIQEEIAQRENCNVPWAILLDPTSACNLHCTGCWAAEYGHKLSLSLDTIDNIIQQGKELGTYMYIYTGGEPMVRKKDLITLCERHPDCEFLSFTNGTLIDEEFCKEMIRVKNFVPAISLEGFEGANDGRRGKGVFTKVQNAMKLLKKHNLPFGISTCYTSANYQDITSEAFFDMLIDAGAMFVWFFHYMPVGNDAVPALLPTPEQRKLIYERIRRFRETKPIFSMDFQNDAEYVGGCIAGGRRYLHINAADTSALTGESMPRDVEAGMDVISGCINQTGILHIRTTKEFGESTVSKILDLVENASDKKAKTENFITRFAKYYTPAVVIGALALAILPPLITGQPFMAWIYRALTFLVISCPCALVISIPLSFFGGIGGASKSGVLVKGSNYLEILANTEIVVFDKTGTLTKGSFAVTELRTEGVSKDQLLEIAAYAEDYSNHPISQSIKKAYNKVIDSSRIQDVQEIAGHGVHAIIDGQSVFAGNTKLMELEGITIPYTSDVGTLIYIAVDNKYWGHIVIEDEIKPDAAEAITSLKSCGVRQTIMLTGDSDAVGQKVASKLGLDHAYTELLPADKVERVERLLSGKNDKTSLAFVGDGINDAPVLARADVGIAMGGLGSDAAIEAADVVLMTDEPSKIATVIKIARKTLRIAHENIVFALAVKFLVLFLGAIGYASMWAAVFADVGVSVIAILNAIRAMNVKKYN